MLLDFIMMRARIYDRQRAKERTYRLEGAIKVYFVDKETYDAYKEGDRVMKDWIEQYCARKF